MIRNDYWKYLKFVFLFSKVYDFFWGGGNFRKTIIFKTSTPCPCKRVRVIFPQSFMCFAHPVLNCFHCPCSYEIPRRSILFNGFLTTYYLRFLGECAKCFLRGCKLARPFGKKDSRLLLSGFSRLYFSQPLSFPGT